MPEAVLSAIVVTPGSCRQVLPLLRRLRTQTIRDRMEIVFVTTAVVDLDPDENLLAGFASWKAAALGQLVSMAAARSAGIRAASCRYIVFTEEHCFPEETWAQAIVDAFERQAADAVGSLMGNANPELPLSWINLCREYGHWMAPHPGGLADHLPGHNSAYRRDLLLALGDTLTAAIESEYALHLEWRAQGRRLWLEPGARVSHVNITSLWADLKAVCAFQRPWANSRAARWTWLRRLVYALSSPLIPAVRFRRVIRDMRRTGHGRLVLRMLPYVVVTLLAGGLGEFLGYLGSVGNAHALLLEVELYRERFLSPEDKRGLALFG